jgi:LytS/YehU family sensor histidine kinase
MFIYLNEKLEFESMHTMFMGEIYHLYFQLDTVFHDKEQALNHYILASHWKDSIHNEQSRKQWAMMQGEYETERAENKIQYLEKENEVSNMKVRQSKVYLFAMGAFILILALVAILFVRQNRARAEHRNVLLEQKMLRLQMNPHFVYNSLSDLQGFIWSEDKLKANDYLSSFSRLMRLILENSRQDFVPVEKEINAIEHYLKLQSLRYQGRFEYKLEIDEEIDEEHMLIPPMLSQPFIENSIEHGILPKGSTGHIEVKFTLKHDIINIDVIDDGIGFSGSSGLKNGTTPQHESLAMQITKERLLLIYRKYKQKINFSFADILDDDNEVKGARVSFAVPFSLI